MSRTGWDGRDERRSDGLYSNGLVLFQVQHRYTYTTPQNTHTRQHTGIQSYPHLGTRPIYLLCFSKIYLYPPLITPDATLGVGGGTPTPSLSLSHTHTHTHTHTPALRPCLTPIILQLRRTLVGEWAVRMRDLEEEAPHSFSCPDRQEAWRAPQIQERNHDVRTGYREAARLFTLQN